MSQPSQMSLFLSDLGGRKGIYARGSINIRHTGFVGLG